MPVQNLGCQIISVAGSPSGIYMHNSQEQDSPHTRTRAPYIDIYGTPTHKHITLILLVNHIPYNWLIVDILGCVYNIKRMYFVLYAKILPRWVPGHWFKGVRHAEPDLKIFNSSTQRNNFTRELSNGFIILGTDKSLDPG